MVGTDEGAGTQVGNCDTNRCDLKTSCALYLHCSVHDDLNAIEDGKYGAFLARAATFPNLRRKLARARRAQLESTPD